jgi:iron complex outermembrane recepter protein
MKKALQLLFFLFLFFAISADAIIPRRIPVLFTLRTAITVSAPEDFIPGKIVLRKDALESNPSLTPDGAMRFIPAFSLFRRTGSRTANPTTQGVSLRGVGASGAGRALVLFDGIPLNDPFGGWVYWNRIPAGTLRSIDVFRGGTSDVFGADALSGAIHFQRLELSSNYTALDAVAGNQNTSLASFVHDEDLGGDFLIRGAGQYFHSDGDFLVETQNRGVVDTRAGSEHASAEILLQKTLSAGRLFLTNSYYSESRENGTVLQTNETSLWQISAGGELFDVSKGEMWFRIYGGGQNYDQTFSAISTDRGSEVLVRNQHVPSQHIGLTFRWNRTFGNSHTVYSGIAFRDVEGETEEDIISTGGAIFQGGRERTSGWFLQDRIRLGERVALTLGSRFDFWQKRDGHSRSLDSSGAGQVETFANTSEWQWNPRVVFEWRLSPSVEFVSTAYRSFRPPTLNELYRAFRVGNVLTLANEELSPERLIGAESGVQYRQGTANLRLNFFWNRIEDPVTNFTLETSPDLIVRQRANLGSTVSKGLEMEGEMDSSAGEIGVAYQFVDSEFVEAADPLIAGNALPQVPRHAGSIFYGISLPSEIGLQFRARAASRSYDDDRNELVLPGYWTADLFVSKNLSRRFKLVLGVENLLNQRIVVSRTPIPTVATSTLVTAGIQLRL